MLSILIGVLYLIRLAIAWRRNNSNKAFSNCPVDLEDPLRRNRKHSSSRSSRSSDSAIVPVVLDERRSTVSSILSGSSTTATTTARSFLSSSTYTRSESIPIPVRPGCASPPIYAEIPIVVKPLSLPRAVERIGSVRHMTPKEKQESLRLKIREIQDSLKALSYSKLQCNLIIGVNSSGKRIGGYCVHPGEHWASMYTLKVQDLPWNIDDEEDAVEIGMKNFLFALILWKDEIKRAKSIRVYTGHQSISQHTRNETCCALLRHYQECEKVVVVNEEEIFAPQTFPSCSSGCTGDSWYCNYPVDMDPQDIQCLDSDESFLKFVRFVQPAIDLSHWRIKDCEKFLTNLYNIEGSTRVHKTHFQIVSIVISYSLHIHIHTQHGHLTKVKKFNRIYYSTTSKVLLTFLS